MLLDDSAAKALAAIVILSTQGLDALTPQLPLQVVDSGDSWLVKGTPYTDKNRRLRYCMCYVFFRKISAEILGIGCDARMVLTEKEKAHWLNTMSRDEYDRIFGPRTQFEPSGVRDIFYAAYGGLINKPEDAIEYAYVLMHTKPALASIPKSKLQATERDKVWHIVAKTSGHGSSIEILSFSRRDGRLMSGNL